MNVDGLMTDTVLMVDPDDRVDTAEAMMSLAESRHVPVVSDGHVVGIISQRDLLASLPSAPLRARDVMSRPALTVGPHEDIVRAAEIMLSHRISSLPVVEDERLVGILTTADMLTHVAERLGETDLKVSALMHCEPLYIIQTSERLDVARLLMRAGPCRHLPVFEGRRLVGIVSDRDLLASLPSRQEAIIEPERIRRESAIPVGRVMTPNPITIGPNEQAVYAAEQLLERQIGALPVINEGRLIGMITEVDFLTWLVTQAHRLR